MHIDLPAIEAFLAVAEGGSTYSGARTLGLSQASVSRRISRLEVLLGSRLFLRSGRGLALTSAGSQFLSLARQHVGGLRGAIDEVRMAGTGRPPAVNIACLATLALFELPSIIAELGQVMPDLRLRILDIPPALMEETVKTGHADFAVTMIGIGAAELVHEPIFKQPIVLVVRRGDPLEGKPSVRWDDLAGLRMIGMGPSSAHFQLLESVRPRVPQVWEEFHQVQRITTALAMVAAGNGAALLPLSPALEQTFDVSVIPVVDPVITRQIGILRRAAAPLSTSAEFVRRRIAARLRAYHRKMPASAQHVTDTG